MIPEQNLLPGNRMDENDMDEIVMEEELMDERPLDEIRLNERAQRERPQRERPQRERPQGERPRDERPLNEVPLLRHHPALREYGEQPPTMIFVPRNHIVVHYMCSCGRHTRPVAIHRNVVAAHEAAGRRREQRLLERDPELRRMVEGHLLPAVNGHDDDEDAKEDEVRTTDFDDENEIDR